MERRLAAHQEDERMESRPEELELEDWIELVNRLLQLHRTVVHKVSIGCIFGVTSERLFLGVAPRLDSSEGMLAKKDTYLALLRRGIDETTAQQLADSGLKIGDLKKIDKDMLIENYGLKADIADGVISIITAGLKATVKNGICQKPAPRKNRNQKLKKSNSAKAKGRLNRISRTERAP